MSIDDQEDKIERVEVHFQFYPKKRDPKCNYTSISMPISSPKAIIFARPFWQFGPPVLTYMCILAALSIDSCS